MREAAESTHCLCHYSAPSWGLIFEREGLRAWIGLGLLISVLLLSSFHPSVLSLPLCCCQLVKVSENLSSLSSEWPTIKMMSELGSFEAVPFHPPWWWCPGIWGSELVSRLHWLSKPVPYKWRSNFLTLLLLFFPSPKFSNSNGQHMRFCDTLKKKKRRKQKNTVLLMIMGQSRNWKNSFVLHLYVCLIIYCKNKL